MANKKPYSRDTNPADRKKDKGGAPKLQIPPIVKPDHKPGTQPPADTQRPSTRTQPAPAKPKPPADESTK